MTLLQAQPWEIRLLVEAREAFNSQRLLVSLQADSSELAAAYRHCEAITAQHSRTFYMASTLLPKEERLAARALYAFCRVTDDIVDDPSRTLNERQYTLDSWRHAVLSDYPFSDNPVCLAWADSQVKFDIPRGYAQQLIDGCERDIQQTRYQSFDELAAYSYGVASTVGLMAMHIVGFGGEDALPYAVRLGVALQMTNILRDVGEDWRNGRVYLPQNELRDFGLTELDIQDGQVDERWRAFMAFQIERNRRLYTESLPGIAMLDPDGRFAIAAAAELYQAILSDIEQHDYDVFNRRAHIGIAGKLRRLPMIWWRSLRATIQ